MNINRTATGDPLKPYRYTVNGREVPLNDPAIHWERLSRQSFAQIERGWGVFDLDAAANEADAMCSRWLGPGGELADALDPDQQWPEFHRVYAHPPTGWCRRWVMRMTSEVAWRQLQVSARHRADPGGAPEVRGVVVGDVMELDGWSSFAQVEVVNPVTGGRRVATYGVLAIG